MKYRVHVRENYSYQFDIEIDEAVLYEKGSSEGPISNHIERFVLGTGDLLFRIHDQKYEDLPITNASWGVDDHWCAIDFEEVEEFSVMSKEELS